VFEAAEGFQGAVAPVVVLPARDDAPLRSNRPDDGEIVLVDLVVVLDVVGAAGGAVVRVGNPGAPVAVVAHGVVTIAIAEVDDFVRVVFRLIVEHGAAGMGAALIRIPVEGGTQAPVVVEAIQVLQRVGRNIGG